MSTQNITFALNDPDSGQKGQILDCNQKVLLGPFILCKTIKVLAYLEIHIYLQMIIFQSARPFRNRRKYNNLLKSPI